MAVRVEFEGGWLLFTDGRRVRWKLKVGFRVSSLAPADLLPGTDRGPVLSPRRGGSLYRPRRQRRDGWDMPHPHFHRRPVTSPPSAPAEVVAGVRGKPATQPQETSGPGLPACLAFFQPLFGHPMAQRPGVRSSPIPLPASTKSTSTSLSAARAGARKLARSGSEAAGSGPIRWATVWELADASIWPSWSPGVFCPITPVRG
jgi:hypothetical protein